MLYRRFGYRPEQFPNANRQQGMILSLPMFAEITRKRIRRGTFTSVPALIAAIREYVRIYNRNPKPFIWTAKPSTIMRKVRHCKEALETGH